ncbi:MULTISPECIES: ABC transporter permease [Micrococcaceae]|uniref:Transport permease protein n=1 Tax=Pseudarthrobacter sulfonivorans TaxID=121292 RepID=A0A0U3QQB7_9MICC|nr:MULTISPECIES: ABC transporter permease [Micrococcaceae]ALV43723.1 antibiotic ABC transporter permease [Pseudarthrobacter sulfonivorans]KRE70681.1 antibiotic ABC transporter permease [Arthrobacter sp. Soil762]MCO4237742.1 ABC transporter permease [Pseudarthrobacter sp. MDT3-28]MCO4249856.1 ABC transporter permease [Pseudarthrobacter sp. MDT3-9]MCO4262125.1 ABC transporter permease [Pseudarthrobacter sp. MDT3-26]
MLLATTRRVLDQLRHDHRSIALILVVPALLLTAVYFLYENETLPPGVPRTFDRVGLMMLAIFPFVVMFLVTSITMLRERTSGTLERLLTTPIHKADLLFGYGLAFSIMAALQSLVATAVAYWIFGLDIQGSPGLVVMIAVINAVLGVALGLLCSAFARTEFQAVQFMPVVVVPQILLCGLFVARERMNEALEAVSNVLPLTFSVDALQEIAANTEPTDQLWMDAGVIVAIVLAVLVLASLTLRRRTA